MDHIGYTAPDVRCALYPRLLQLPMFCLDLLEQLLHLVLFCLCLLKVLAPLHLGFDCAPLYVYPLCLHYLVLLLKCLVDLGKSVLKLS